jgi:hypothetical protein
MYALDVARLLPCSAPSLPKELREGFSHLFQLLRPELVASHPVALNSDGKLFDFSPLSLPIPQSSLLTR